MAVGVASLRELAAVAEMSAWEKLGIEVAGGIVLYVTLSLLLRPAAYTDLVAAVRARRRAHSV